MNYGGNMPDWHQYNASQTNEVIPSPQNVNSGHLAFIPGVSPPTLNALSLNSEGLNKHQSDANFNPRNFQSFNNVSSGPNIPNNSPLASMVQMQNCIGHYGSQNTRNPMLDNINTSVDPRNTTIGTINDEMGYRTNQVPFNGPIGHLSGPSCNLNVSSGSVPGPGPGPGPRTNSGLGSITSSGTGTGPSPMFGSGSRHGPIPGPGSGSGPGNLGPRNNNISSAPTKSGPPSFIPCKGLCCNSDPNINYQQWDKFGSYQNNTSFRDSVHPSGYQIENRHFGNNCNFRKDNLEGKEVMGPVLPNASAIDHRRNYADYKYHKDHLVHRNYSASSGMFHNYPMQGYNYSADYQKYTYPMKEHPKTNNINISNSGMLKHQEQNFIAQQKFNNKPFQYQNGNMLAKGMPTLNVNANMTSSSQNPYFNSQFSRNIPAEVNHECQETTDNAAIVNRVPGTFMHNSQHQVYQHKIAMQKFSMENHLRELSRIPGYQSHPKYKECILRYREVLKLQQSSGYQNPVQQATRVATPVNAAVPPINLQFDQNGILINSNYIPDSFPKVQHPPTIEQSAESIEKQTKDQAIAIANEKRQHVQQQQRQQQQQQQEQLMIPSQSEHVPSSCAETFQKQNQFSIPKDYNQNQLKVQTSESHSFDALAPNTSNETTMMQQKVSKEFANKPELDVRQFLANWDETDDEEGATSNLQDAVLSETTPVVVVSYENVDLSSKTPQATEGTKRNSYCSNETGMDNGKESETNVITAQDCLTISYSSSDRAEIAKTGKRTIREGVVKPGSIIHCISNGPDEIPTIHIVDNLEISNILGASNEQVIETLEKQKPISFFTETSNNEGETMTLKDTEQLDKNETHVLPVGYDSPLDATKDTNIENSSSSGTIQTTTISMNNSELRVLTASKNNLDTADNMDLKKQNSFEESHNPDDISLPDLPTSECTPISTTLNTPIHSDTEESSQNMEDLSISTNPIEVMQNSPVISFTQVNSEEKLRNRTLDTLGLEFRKENRYKVNDTDVAHQREVNLGNLDFSVGNCKAKSAEIVKEKQLKTLGTNAVKKKVFLIESKENDTRVSDALTSIEYELKEPTEDEKSLSRESPSCTQEGERKNVRGSMDSMKSDSNANLSATESDEETKASRRRKIKTSNVSTNTSLSEIDLNGRKRARESTAWEDKCEKYLERNLAQKKDMEHTRQSENTDARRFDDTSSAQGGEHSVCHTTSQYSKHYSVAVIKNNVTLNDKRSHGTTERTEKSPEVQSRTSNSTKEQLSEGIEIRKHVSGKLVSSSHESVQFQSSKRSELLLKDLRTVDGDVRYTAEEIRMLKEYRRKKEKLHQAQDKSRQHSVKTVEDESQKDTERNVSTVINLSTENLNMQEEKVHGYSSKSFVKSADFGIQVANVSLKIKDNEKEVIQGDKGSQEQIKDPLEGIKIEINVSRADRNAKGQEQNKRPLYDDRNKRYDYEIDDSSTCSNARRSHAKEHDTLDALKMIDKARKVADDTNVASTCVADTGPSTTLDKSGTVSLETNEGSRETGDLTSERQSVRSSRNNDVLCRDTTKADAIEGTNYSVDQTDAVKSKCAISNTAIVDANNKIKAKKSRSENGDRGEDRHFESVQLARVQKQISPSLVDASTIMEAFKRHENKEVTSVLSALNRAKKLPSSDATSAKSLNSLNALDLNLDNLDNLDCQRRSDVGLDHARANELDDDYAIKWKKPKIDQIFEDCDMFQSSSGYVNPIFTSLDKLENLHAVPVYTTKDGKISYSPNRRFTYHELMMEARKREACTSARRSHYADTWNSYYSSKFRKLYKKKRHHALGDRKKHEFKDTKYLYERKRNYSDEFYGRSHVKYKDYVHSIKNNNAVWLDHCKMDRIYSSSDSEEEIVGRNKNRFVETNSCRRNHAAESKTASRSSKNEITVDELDLESRSKQGTVSDVHLDEDKDRHLEESQSIQSLSIDNDKNNENCPSSSNNVNNNVVPVKADASSIETMDHHRNENVNSNLDRSLILGESCDFISEKLELSETKDSSNEHTDLGKSKDIITSDDAGEYISIRDESSSSKLTNNVLLDENKQMFASTAFVEKENSEMLVSESDTKVSDNLSSMETENNSENKEHIQMCENLEANQIKTSESETNVINCSSLEETSEFQVESNCGTEQVPQESLEAEQSTEMLSEAVKESSEENNNKIDDEDLINSDKNTLECKEETIRFIDQVEILDAEQEHEECLYEEVENTTLEYENDNNFLKEISEENSIIQEEFESQMVQIDETTDQQNDLKCIFIETVENEEDIVIASEQMDDEKLIFMNISNDIQNENDNVAENSVPSNTDEMEITLPNTEETSLEGQVTIDHSKDHSGEHCPNEVQNTSEHNSNGNSSIENEMPVLNMYSTMKNILIEHPDDSKDEVEENEQPERHLSSPDPCKSSNHSLESNTDVKAIPKLVIKKTDVLNPKTECRPDYVESENSMNRYDAKLLLEARPKIPKMIIMKSRSRSATPTMEILEKAKSERTHSPLSEQKDVSVDMDNNSSEQYTLRYNNYESKVPKVKIKLEDISSKDLKLYLKRKASKKSIPKVKIKKLRMQDTKAHVSKFETEDTSEINSTDSDDEEKAVEESLTSDAEMEKVPKLRLKRQDEDKSLSPERTRRKDTAVSNVILKKNRRTREEDSRHLIKHENIAANDDELRKKLPQCIIEKIPKVIIKRTQIGTEFKCEISKSKRTSIAETSKWQPKVKLQRLQLLDHMVKDLKQSRIMLSDAFSTPTRIIDDINDGNEDFSQGGGKVKLCRSSSASSLSPIKYKQRRLSDSDYTKTDTKLATNFSGDSNDIDGRDIDNRSSKKKSKRRLFSQGKRVEDRNLNDENENEMKEMIESVRDNSFGSFLMNEDNDLMVMKDEYSCFEMKESTHSMEDTFLESDIAPSANFDVNDNSIIKIDSSDDSQTTIEILPASPDSSEGEIAKNCELENADGLHRENAIPTQLELELELIDNNNVHHADVLTSNFNDHASHSRNRCINDESTKLYFNKFQCSSQSIFGQDEYVFGHNEQSSEKKSDSYFYCNDLLVKDVLAAKEVLKKCLVQSENENVKRRKSWPKTAAEKKQGLSFNIKDLEESHCTSEGAGCDNDNMKMHKKEKYKFPHGVNIKEVDEKCAKQDKHSSMEKRMASLDSQDETAYSIEYPTASTHRCTSVPELTTISLKAIKKSGQITMNETSANIGDDVADLENKHSNAGNMEQLYEEKSEKKTSSSSQDQKANDSSNEAKAKEDNMPLLVPEFALNFDSSSDIDSSRSPPVITNQEDVNSMVEDMKGMENKMIISAEKIEERKKHSYEDCEMTIADIITQLAYHEKATIKHKRYCNLCERWFPTTSRHRRHLAGYQHRYMELTQRKSIHTLFILFTGKPCPRLLPANVIRNDCSIGELTPLQIAVQDVAKCVEYKYQNLKKKE